MRNRLPLIALVIGVLSPICVGSGERFGVIVHPTALEKPAAAWRDYRVAQGWEIAILSVPSDATAETLRVSIRERIAPHAVAEGTQNAPIIAVLLLGDVGPSQVPTFYFANNDPEFNAGTDGRFASDHPYALLRDDDERTAIAVGRVPVATTAEATRVLNKIARYERDAPLGAWRHRMNYVAGEGHFGGFDALLETLFVAFIDNCLPDAFDISMSYAKADSRWCPPPSRLERTTLERLGEGSLLFNYVGHGHANGLDSLHWGSPRGSKRTPILRGEALRELAASGPRNPIALMSCCSTGWFDLADGRDSIAETMLKHADGPIAVLAGTRPTHPYGNAVFQKEFTRELVAHTELPLGEIDRRARREMLVTDAQDRQLDLIAQPIASLTKWHSSLEALRVMHVRMYALFGDPMLRIANPGVPIDDVRVVEGTLRGSVPKLTAGDVEVVVETSRSGCAKSAQLRSATAGDDVEARTAFNYPLANDRVLWRGTAKLTGGAFSIALPSPLPTEARLVRVYAVGVDSDGRATEAIGGVRVPPSQAATPTK